MSERKTKILVVDDDPDILEQVTLTLGPEGYEVMCADGPEEAEQVLLRTRPDLAIFDLMMTDTDAGFVLCHRAKKLYPGLPVVILTAVTASTGVDFVARTPDEKAWVEADLMLHKPVLPERLRAEVRRLLPAERRPANDRDRHATGHP